MRTHWLLLVLLLLLPVSPALGAEQVEQVIDGDTVLMNNGRMVDLMGVEAPGLSKPFGEAARDYLQRRVEKRLVNLICANGEAKRRSCQLYYNDSDLGLELLWLGLAKRHHADNLYRYDDSEGQAQYYHRGMWSK